ncbi:heavy-metal-associated domain-containing protein [Catenulispora subtropica]|uniref:HMA domain-containing protein n=1 Tax=Catenulispora subtropica TaxID=450798 RepID=A0ABN2TA85_9ACTN
MTELTVIDNDAASAAGCSCCAAPSADAVAATEPKETTVSENATTAVYTVSGMTCGHCVKSVTEEVSAIAGVTAVDVDLASGKVTVTSTAPLAEKDVEAAVDEAGYVLVH